MSWFMMHLNWTWVLANLLTVPFSLAGAPPLVVAVIIMLPASIWVLVMKGRSPAWALLGFIGAPLWLTTKYPKAATDDE